MLEGIYREMVNSWSKPIVQRSEIKDFSFGLLNSPGYLANLDSKNLGPPRETMGSKVFYHKENLAKWMQERNEETVKGVTYKATDGSKNFEMIVYADYLFVGEDGQKLKKIKIKEDIEELLGSADGIEELFERYYGRISFAYAEDDGTYIKSVNAGTELNENE